MMPSEAVELREDYMRADYLSTGLRSWSLAVISVTVVNVATAGIALEAPLQEVWNRGSGDTLIKVLVPESPA
jgi:hypothetical protein